MVGVAPMAGAVRGPSPVAVPPAGAPYFASPPAPAAAPVAGEGGSAFSPPVPQAGVNPLGGTVAAENPGFPLPYGSPGAASPYGAPAPGRMAPGTQWMPGVTPGGPGYAPYAPSGGGGLPLPSSGGALPLPSPPPPPPQHDDQGAPPNPYGARPPNAYGTPPGHGASSPQGGFGQSPVPPAPLAPYAAQGAALSSTPPSLSLKKRNALLTWLLPALVILAGVVLSVVLAFISPALSMIGSIITLGGLVWSLLLAIVMANELKAITRNVAFSWVPILIPFYGLYWAWILVPQEVAKAKQLRGVQRPPQSILLYILLWHFALASDLNDMAR